MSSSQTCRESSKAVYDDAHELLLEQTAPHLPQSTIGSLNNQRRLASTFESSDRHLAVGERTRSEPQRKQVVRATLYRRIAGCQYELNYGPTRLENTNKSRPRSRSEDSLSSNGSTAHAPKLFAVDLTNQTPRRPSTSESIISRTLASSQLQCPKRSIRVCLSPKSKFLKYKLKTAGSGDDASLAATACKDFEAHMMRIPAEICQMIMDMIFEEAFGPRRVHPHKDPPIKNIFLALDKELYDKSFEQYWTKNTWVISKGPLNKTMRFMTEKPYNETTTEFSLQTPNKAALSIRSVELSFSNADTPDLNEWHYLARQRASAPYTTPIHFSLTIPAPSNETQSQNAQQNIARAKRAERYDEIQHQLIHTWQDKFDRVAMLNLRHLTLDFTEAYDPGGLSLGVNLVPRLIPFAHGMPADFKILAPNSRIETQIRDAFFTLNAG